MAPRSSTLDHTVRDVLTAATADETSIRLPDGQLAPKLYQGVNKALVAIGGKWDRRAKAHLFEQDPRELLAEMLASGVVPAPEQKLNSYWPTPARLAERMAAPFAALPAGSTILEPSAGDGAIVRALRAANPGLRIIAVEPDIQRCGKNLEADERHCCLFETWLDRPAEKLAGIVMNPPFTVPGDHLAYLAHLEMAMDYLDEHGGGDLVAIVPAGFIHRSDKRIVELRSRLEELGAGMDPVEDRMFAESGTNVATVLVEVEIP